MFFSLPTIGTCILPIDRMTSFVFDVIRPIRFCLWCSGGFIYSIYAYFLSLPTHLIAGIGSVLCRVDPSYYGRCTNTRNFFIMSVCYMVVTRMTCTRCFTYPFIRPLAWLFENLYLIPCPVLRAESMLDPVTHENVYPSDYTSIWDRMCCI